jgi:biopolymer transport protein ExbD
VASSEPTQEKIDIKDMLTIQVSDQGNVYWNRELIDLDEVPARLEQYKKQVQIPRILVAGDDRARWGVTVQVLDEVRKANIEKVSMETHSRPTGR